MKILLLLLVLLGLVPICNAEPSPAVQYLMNEPVTLFDWGMIRLYDYLVDYTTHYLKTNSVQDIYCTVRYDCPSKPNYNINCSYATGAAGKRVPRVCSNRLQGHRQDHHPDAPPRVSHG